MVDTIRVTDYAARYGGEEFVIVLPETSTAKAIELGERLLINIAKNSITLEGGKIINITASIGTSSFPEHADSWNGLLAVADFAMYEAKKSGRNQLKIG